MDFSVIIVNFNTKDLLLQAIASALAQKEVSAEIIVVDNASRDGSARAVKERYPGIRLIESPRNLGFAGANNLAWPEVRGDYLVLLNSDAELQPGALGRMREFMTENSRAGVAGGKVLKPDGSLDLACRRSFPTPLTAFFRYTGLGRLFPKSPLFGRYNLTYLDIDKTYPVDSVVGAYLVARQEAVRQVGFLDEQFFMYGEDLDFCYRMKEAGWEVYYVHDSVVLHHKGASGRPPAMVREFFRAMTIFHRKHYAHRYSRWQNVLIQLGISLVKEASLLSSRKRTS